MLTRLVALLNKLEPDCTPEEIGDILWFANYLDAPTTSSQQTLAPEEDKPAPGTNPRSTLPSTKSDDMPPLAESTRPAQETKSTTAEPVQSQLYPAQSENRDKPTVGLKAIDFRVPRIPALPGALEIARALRPLKRRVPSHTRTFFDEEATVQRAAESNTYLPALRSAPRRWLDVILVVDEWHSMVIWQETIQEFQTLLANQGAFRNVQRWQLHTVENGKAVRLTLGESPQPHNASELIDPSGQRLILLVTDCLSPAWETGAMAQTLKAWGERSPLAIVQVLPRNFWRRTALAELPKVHVRVTSPGLPNARLHTEWLWDEYDEPLTQWLQSEVNQQQGIVAPIITLEPRPLLDWATSLANGNNAWGPGYFLPIKPLPREHTTPIATSADNPVEPIDAKMLVRQFKKIASPQARRLAGYLATAPLTLPVMRLVQGVMLPQSRQIHLAEVFLSGLIEQETPANLVESGAVPVEEIYYDFVKGVREELIGENRESETINVLAEVSDYVAKHAGQPFDFRAWLASPSGGGEQTLAEGSRYFANVASQVFRRLGGQYTDLAIQLESNLSPTNPNISELDSAGDFAGRAKSSDDHAEEKDEVLISSSISTSKPKISQRLKRLIISGSTSLRPTIIDRLRSGRVVPIIGSTVMHDFVMGGHDAFIKAYADYSRYPFSNLSLAQVTLFKFIEDDTIRDTLALSESYLNFIKSHLFDLAMAAGCKQEILDDVDQQFDNLTLSMMCEQLGYPAKADEQHNPFLLLAALGLPIYLTTDYHGLMENALRRAGYAPRTDFCRWKKRLFNLPSVLRDGYKPTRQQPLVYHLHGWEGEPESLVLTDDDHYRFMVGGAQNADINSQPVHVLIRAVLEDNSLLMLGYNPRSEEFRSLFWGLIDSRSDKKSSVIQVSPNPIRIEQTYLEKYLTKVHDLDVYWGDTHTYLQELYLGMTA